MDNETRGQRIKRARKARRLTQAQVASATGIAVKTVASIEHDDRNNHADNVAAVMAYLDLPGDPEETRGDYSIDTLAIGDMVMAYLEGLSPADRRAWNRNFVRNITGNG
jgi:transcriptional regulator with XRE-family HTH domain